MKSAPIPKQELERAVRSLCRRIGAIVIQLMAEQDISFADMARRLNKKERCFRKNIHELIEGKPISLNDWSDLGVALGVEWKPEFKEK